MTGALASVTADRALGSAAGTAVLSSALVGGAATSVEAAHR
ncbi:MULTISPECIES: hypothetical protein [unclassified Blastococcus]|nr:MULTISPECIES: hypothetical protein [unclassified Blastococcus]